MDLPNFIDIEASASGAGSYPIEVGVALGSGGTQCFLVSPAPAWDSWDAHAEAIHGINREILVSHGQPIANVAARLNELVGGSVLYSDACTADNEWLGLLFNCAGMKRRFRLEPLRTLLTEEQRMLWDPIKARIRAELALTRHRASMDARISQLTYERTLEIVRTQFGGSAIPRDRLS